MKKEIIDFHIKNGYFIKAQRTKTANGCFIEYPKSILKNLSIDPFIACYFAEDRKIKYYIEKEGTDGEHIELDLPNYAIRPVVAENVLIKTLNLKLNHKLIFCHDKEGLLCENVSDLTQLIDTPILEVDVVKEKILMEMLGHVIQGLDYSQQAQELEVYEGYKIVKKTFDNGGL